MNTPTFRARLLAAERLKNSTNGNPRWRLAFSDGTMATTRSDAMVGYTISDYMHSRYDGTEFDVFTTRAGQVTHMSPIGEEAIR